MAARTILDFQVNQNIWPIIEQWAAENGYYRKGATDSEVLYQKGTGFLVAPQCLLVRHNGPAVHMEAWLPISFLVRLQTLFIMPAEMSIESGGFMAVIPRSMARGAVNNLLARIGAPPIP